MSILEKGFKAIAKGLREFGYPDVTGEQVREAHEAWKRGHKATDIIAMFCERDFNDHPDIFGEKTNDQ